MATTANTQGTKATTGKAGRPAKATVNASAKADNAPVKEGKLSNFQAQVIARQEPETPQKNAINIEKLAVSSINGQIAALKASVVTKEMAVEQAKEDQQKVLFPTDLEVVKNAQSWIEAIVAADEEVTAAETDLKETNDLIVYFEGVLEIYA